MIHVRQVVWGLRGQTQQKRFRFFGRMRLVEEVAFPIPFAGRL